MFVGCQYEGLRYEEGNCGVSIMRSGIQICLVVFCFMFHCIDTQHKLWLYNFHRSFVLSFASLVIIIITIIILTSICFHSLPWVWMAASQQHKVENQPSATPSFLDLPLSHSDTTIFEIIVIVIWWSLVRCPSWPCFNNLCSTTVYFCCHCRQFVLNLSRAHLTSEASPGTCLAPRMFRFTSLYSSTMFLIPSVWFHAMKFIWMLLKERQWNKDCAIVVGRYESERFLSSKTKKRKTPKFSTLNSLLTFI